MITPLPPPSPATEVYRVRCAVPRLTSSCDAASARSSPEVEIEGWGCGCELARRGRVCPCWWHVVVVVGGWRAHLLVVARHLTQQLGCTVPTCLHIFGQRAVAVGVDSTRQSKVTNGEIAVGVDEQVGRFEVAVKHARRVNELEATENLGTAWGKTG